MRFPFDPFEKKAERRGVILTPEQALNDLEWILTSPSLVIDPKAIGRIEFDASTVNDNDETLARLSVFCKRQSEHKVGRYFENLIGFWLEHVRRVEMVGQGIQLHDGNRTLGEMDFLFRDETGSLTHLETTVKFFLHFPNAERSHFPGPNATDNFELKTAKLFGSQLAIGVQHYPDIEHGQALMRGMIFYHPSIPAPAELPARMSPEHAKGVWIRESELDFLCQWEFGSIVSKPFWLSPFLGPNAPMAELRVALTNHFSESGYPVMLSLKDGTMEDKFKNQSELRMFVVPDSWPN